MAEVMNTEKVQKTYWAVVRGYAPESGHVDHPLSFMADDYADKDRTATPEPKPAQTDFKRLATVEIPILVDRYPQTRYSWIELKPITGRRHQLRRHMKHIGHPIIGDARHGKGVHNRFFQAQYNAHRLMLMARELTWEHPYSKQTMSHTAELDDAFKDVFNAFGWE
jgi:tRNA pseudouridine65 synthase